MCSGCSGDYAGGFDSDDSDEPVGDSADSALLAGLSGTGDTGLGQRAWSEASGEGRRDGGPSGLESPAAAWEDCEILVTATQIVEIRVIAANSQGNSAKDHLGKMRAEAHPRDKQSPAESAKYYQTRHVREETSECARRSPRILRSLTQLLPRCSAGASRTRLEGWLGKARRLFRRCTAQTT